MKMFDENFRKFSISKIFKFSTLSSSNFLSNQYFLIFFFMDRCKISLRTRWNHLERLKLHAEKDNRDMLATQAHQTDAKRISLIFIEFITIYNIL